MQKNFFFFVDKLIHCFFVFASISSSPFFSFFFVFFLFFFFVFFVFFYTFLFLFLFFLLFFHFSVKPAFKVVELQRAKKFNTPVLIKLNFPHFRMKRSIE